ncbi:MarR family transcriptional regulator [uncultured Ilyobacter sp.]|uniref:MarR family transcriptional regulator n=1 Tax=uncultured Ilyobacter sp. TaxID=544433 RepID=UPI0029C682A6|nr:MarR family transcriptional regulator [uncultured Ilyobacter sp.]
MELKDKILQLFKTSEPLKASEIVEKLNADEKDMDKVINILKKEEAVISPKGCFYSVDK